MASGPQAMDFAGEQASRGRAARTIGRSLEELAQTVEFQELVEREFSGPAGGWTEPVNRRQFLVLVAASLGLAGLSGCSPAPSERIMPYVRVPDGLSLAGSSIYATAMPLAGDALGLLVESHEGRPTKVEGNPDHPGSLKLPGSPDAFQFGPTDIFAQASVLTLYDPDRSSSVTHLGNISTWDAFASALRQAMRSRGDRTRVRVLTETVASPTLGQQLRRLLERFPRGKWYAYEPIGRDNVASGSRHAFGEYVEAAVPSRSGRRHPGPRRRFSFGRSVPRAICVISLLGGACVRAGPRR